MIFLKTKGKHGRLPCPELSHFPFLSDIKCDKCGSHDAYLIYDAFEEATLKIQLNCNDCTNLFSVDIPLEDFYQRILNYQKTITPSSDRLKQNEIRIMQTFIEDYQKLQKRLTKKQLKILDRLVFNTLKGTAYGGTLNEPLS